MSSRTTKGIWLGSDGKFSVESINVDDRYTPQGSQTLVEVAWSAINPADRRHFYMGMSDYVAGYEWVGEAIETGPDSPFKVGQQLFGLTLAGNHRPISYGVHQDYLIAEAAWTHELPTSLDPKAAVAFSVAVRTATDALFNQIGAALPAAGVSGEAVEGEAILIWGGGGIVGQTAVQLAKMAGFSPIITTASPKNHEYLKELGATWTIDYRSPEVVEQVRSALRGKKLRMVFDAVTAGLGLFEGLSKEEEAAVQAKYHLSSPALGRKCVDEGEKPKLASVLPVPQDPEWVFVMPYRIPDGIELPQSEGIEDLFTGVPREWGNRMQKVLAWILKDGAKRWTPPRLRIVHGAEASVVAINEVFEGKAGGDKLIIEHPLN